MKVHDDPYDIDNRVKYMKLVSLNNEEKRGDAIIVVTSDTKATVDGIWTLTSAIPVQFHIWDRRIRDKERVGILFLQQLFYPHGVWPFGFV